MDLSGLATLKEKLVGATEFAPVWDYFMTHFGEQPAFMRLGDPVRSAVLDAAVAQAAQAIFGKPVPVSNLMLIRVSEHRFIHGGLQLQGRFGNLLYFEDVGVGLLTVMLSFSGDSRFVRFTASSGPGGELTRQ